MLKKIKSLLDKPKKIQKPVERPVVDDKYYLDKYFDKNGFLVMQEDESLRDFVFYCDIAMKTKIFFDRVLLPPKTYTNIYNELIRSKMLVTHDGKKNVSTKPFTEDGKQAMYGLTDPFAKRDVKVYTIKPKEFLVIN